MITTFLKEILSQKISKDAFQKHFYEELIELINDEDMLVRLEGLEVVIEIMQTKITAEQIE